MEAIDCDGRSPSITVASAISSDSRWSSSPAPGWPAVALAAAPASWGRGRVFVPPLGSSDRRRSTPDAIAAPTDAHAFARRWLRRSRKESVGSRACRSSHSSRVAPTRLA